MQLFDKCKKAVDDAARAQGELEHLKREIHRLNEELVRLRDDSDRRVFTSYNAFSLTSDGVALAQAYRTKRIERYLKSGAFLRAAASYVSWYAAEAIGRCQDVVDKAAKDDEVILDVQGMILALPPNCPEFKGDPNEPATARWWSGLYQEAAMGCQLTATPAIMPDSAVPLEVCVEDVASTSRPADRED